MQITRAPANHRDKFSMPYEFRFGYFIKIGQIPKKDSSFIPARKSILAIRPPGYPSSMFSMAIKYRAISFKMSKYVKLIMILQGTL